MQLILNVFFQMHNIWVIANMFIAKNPASCTCLSMSKFPPFITIRHVHFHIFSLLILVRSRSSLGFSSGASVFSYKGWSANFMAMVGQTDNLSVYHTSVLIIFGRLEFNCMCLCNLTNLATATVTYRCILLKSEENMYLGFVTLEQYDVRQNR